MPSINIIDRTFLHSNYQKQYTLITTLLILPTILFIAELKLIISLQIDFRNRIVFWKILTLEEIEAVIIYSDNTLLEVDKILPEIVCQY